MDKGIINKVVREINKLARERNIMHEIYNIEENFDEFIEDYYFVNWIQRNYEDEYKEFIFNVQEAEDRLDDIIEEQIEKTMKMINVMIIYNKNDILMLQKYSKADIEKAFLEFIECNDFEIEENYLFEEMENILLRRVGNYEWTKYNQIKFFLYNYKNIEKLIEERKSELISRINVSNVNYLKGLKEDTNTLENTI